MHDTSFWLESRQGSVRVGASQSTLPMYWRGNLSGTELTCEISTPVTLERAQMSARDRPVSGVEYSFTIGFSASIGISRPKLSLCERSTQPVFFYKSLIKGDKLD